MSLPTRLCTDAATTSKVVSSVVVSPDIQSIDLIRRVAKYVEISVLGILNLCPFYQASQPVKTTALFLYDYLLTLPREVEVVWPKMLCVSSAIYFTTRYLPVANIIYAIITTPVTQVFLFLLLHFMCYCLLKIHLSS
jgi:hypothetical protein